MPRSLGAASAKDPYKPWTELKVPGFDTSSEAQICKAVAMMGGTATANDLWYECNYHSNKNIPDICTYLGLLTRDGFVYTLTEKGRQLASRALSTRTVHALHELQGLLPEELHAIQGIWLDQGLGVKSQG